jgi:hypothetical protein
MQKAAIARIAIPEPANNVNALYETCQTLKQAVEQMLGRYEEQGFGFRTRMTVADSEPVIERDGEFWLSEGVSNVLSVSYQGKWRKLGPIT